MSVARKVKVALDLRMVERAARKMGITVERNAFAKGYGNERVGNYPLVLKNVNRGYDLGVSETEVAADYHGGYVDNFLKDFLPEYFKEVVAEDGFEATEVAHNGEETVIRICR